MAIDATHGLLPTAAHLGCPPVFLFFPLLAAGTTEIDMRRRRQSSSRDPRLGSATPRC